MTIRPILISVAIGRGTRHADRKALHERVEATRDLAAELALSSRELAELTAGEGRRRLLGTLERAAPAVRRAIDKLSARDVWAQAGALPARVAGGRRRRWGLVIGAGVGLALIAALVLYRRGRSDVHSEDDPAAGRA